MPKSKEQKNSLSITDREHMSARGKATDNGSKKPECSSEGWGTSWAVRCGIDRVRRHACTPAARAGTLGLQTMRSHHTACAGPVGSSHTHSPILTQLQA